MTRQDFRTLMARITAIEPAYLKWVSEESVSIGAAAQMSDDEAYERMAAEWMKAVEPYSLSELGAVLDDIASTAKPLPSYSKIWRTIAGYAADNRAAVREGERYERERQRRFHCLECHDVGYVTVYNPKFIDWLRPTFEAHQSSVQFPAGWYRLAISQWNMLVRRGEQRAPAEVQLVCNCECPTAKIYRRQLERLAEYMANPEDKPVRAAYIGQWHSRHQPRVRIGAKEDLSAWYEAHPEDNGGF